MALPNLRSFKTDQRGFISVVALGIFALLVIVSLTVLEANVKTAESIKNSNKYYEAQDIAGSVMEYLQYTMKDMEAGFSIVKETCSYSDGEYVGDGGAASEAQTFQQWLDDKCPDIATLAGNEPSGSQTFLCAEKLFPGENDYCGQWNGKNISCLEDLYKKKLEGASDSPIETPEVCKNVGTDLTTLIAGKNVEITVNIEGKSEKEDYFTDCFDILENPTCYVVPIPGSGTAGENCAQYKAYENGQETQSATAYITSIGKPIEQGSNTEYIPRIDHPCNWNKLKLGSSSSDRVSIPFYYQDEEGVVNPYNEEEQFGPPGKFVLRMRTPCADGSATCDWSERMYIVEPEKGAVAQWQMSGLCDGEECGLIPFKGNNTEQSSVISSEQINSAETEYNIMISEYFLAIDTSNYDGSEGYIYEILKEMEKPLLTIFLSGKMKTYSSQGPNGKINIPYLEYQLLTDRQIGQPTTKMEVIVSVDGNTYKKVLYKQEQKPLVDFAIQN